MIVFPPYIKPPKVPIPTEIKRVRKTSVIEPPPESFCLKMYAPDIRLGPYFSAANMVIIADY